jgi:hypothetical protein
MIEAFLNRRGFYKIPPRHSWKELASTPIGDLTAYGRTKLPEWQTNRAKVKKLWALLDELRG